MTELAVLVPVLNRPQNVAPLVESFLANCPPDSRLIFLTSYDDAYEQAVIKKVMRRSKRIADTSIHAAKTWPQKINWGVRFCEGLFPTTEWFLCAADDVEFTEGWWEATAELRSDPRIGVIGTNDQMLDGSGGNPRVQVEQLVIHPIVRATYIRDFGTIDEPGKVLHEGYAHWCCDDELLWTARSRDAYAYCEAAHIPHHHPYFGTGEMDDTYRLGEANSQADMALWKRRAPLLGLQVI